MASDWYKGVLTASSWHQEETVAEMPDAATMIQLGQQSGAWPIGLREEALFTSEGLDAGIRAIIADYYVDAQSTHPASKVVGGVGDRYNCCTPENWASLVTAAAEAGAKPTGAFALRDGRRVLATFEVDTGNGLKTNLLLVDSFDGTLEVTCGFSTIRVVCANTLAAAFRANGKDFVRVRHTASIEKKIEALRTNIEAAVQAGQNMRETFEAAENMNLRRRDAGMAFDLFFPPAPKDATKHAQTRAENRREEAYRACMLDINRVGSGIDNLATLWNGATYLVDREVDGSPRKARGDADRLDSLLFGQRSKRIQEIQTIVEVIMRDGTIMPMTQTEALEAGVDGAQVGRAVIADLLGEALS